MILHHLQAFQCPRLIFQKNGPNSILRGERRTYAWATLCVAPYFIYGVTEVLANPAVRVAAAAILFASLAWFASLVDYLRRSRPAATSAQDAPGA